MPSQSPTNCLSGTCLFVANVLSATGDVNSYIRTEGKEDKTNKPNININ